MLMFMAYFACFLIVKCRIVTISYGQGRKLQYLHAWQHIEKLLVNDLVQEVPTCGHTSGSWAVILSQKENMM